MSDGRKAKLTRHRVLEAARQAVADDGLDALTIRGVATRLGVSPMALYRHVADRDALVAGVVDEVLGGVELPPHPTTAEARAAWLRDMAADVRRRLVEHPGVAEVLMVTGPTGEKGLWVMDRICHVLADTGRTPADVAGAYTWLMVTVAAYAARTARGRALADRAGIPHASLRDVFTERVAPYADRLPHLARTAAAFGTDPDRSAADAVAHIVATLTADAPPGRPSTGRGHVAGPGEAGRR